MKLSNLPFTLIVMAISVVILAICGWLSSFMLGLNFDPVGDASDVKVFFLRAFAGVLMLGIVNGIRELKGFFVFLMKNAPTK